MPEKNINTDKTTEARVGEERSASICPVATQQSAQTETVCEVCGHVNKGQSLICEMCSNYLFD